MPNVMSIKEMQVEVTMKYVYAILSKRTAKLQKIVTTLNVGEDARSLSFKRCLWEFEVVFLVKFYRIFKNEICDYPCAFMPENYSFSHKNLYTNVRDVLYVTIKNYKQPKCPLVGGWYNCAMESCRVIQGNKLPILTTQPNFQRFC